MSNFSKTQPIETWMAKQGLLNLELLETKSGTIFIKDDEGNTHRCSKDLQEITEDLMVSWFAPDDAEASWMIHFKGEGGAKVLSSFSLSKTKTKAPF